MFNVDVESIYSYHCAFNVNGRVDNYCTVRSLIFKLINDCYNSTMLCAVCNKDIIDGDDLQCMKCKEYLHFSCASMREANFQKMNKLNKDKWSCVKCRTTTAAVCNTSITQDDNTFVGSNEKLLGLTESVKFLSNQFDVFSKQLNEVLNSIKDLKEENKKLKKTNGKLFDDVCILNRKINVLEQKSIIKNIELIGVP